ncbi:Tc toxin subunit A [Pseudomonas sp.]|uniref:Tc toxin subunit A n=1 Tax=Pseudomonas sp. TaxID=306 RepID=UPI003F3771C3
MDDFPLLQSLIKTSSTDEKLQTYFKTTLKLTSVFDVVRFTEAEFNERFKLHNLITEKDGTTKENFKDIDLGKLYDNAKCFAAQISHLYREQQLSSPGPQHHWHPPGIRGVDKQGPTYTNLFQENWNDACKIDSIAAIDSPVAYLRALYLFAKQLESSTSESAAEKANRIPLHQRRPDLEKLSIDHQSTFTAQPMLKIVNQILDENIQEAIKGTTDEGKSAYQVLAQKCYPFALPYEFFHHQCLLGFSAKRLSLGELNYLISTHLPLTQTIDNQYGNVLSATSADARKLMSGLGPQQQKVLTDELLNEKFLTETGNLKSLEQMELDARTLYWKKNYGISKPSSLRNLNTFLERTGLNAEQMEMLLALGKHAPRKSTSDLTKTPVPYGARYVNGPHSACATLKLVNKKGNTKKGSTKRIDQLTDRRLERLNRMIRLHRWLDIPFADLDSLIVSAFESQIPRNTSMQLDAHTVSVLGIYRYFNRRYSIDAEEFGALLHQVTPYSNREAPSLFDRVFNRAQLFDKPLALDGRTFTADNSDPTSHTILQHLSASLGVALTEDSLLHIVKNTEQFLGSLKCDLRTLSSIYRQARIARLFGISIAECATLAKWLGGESITRCLTNGNTGICTLRITAERGQEKFEVVAYYQLATPSGPERPALLLPGSTLTTTTSWFANSDTVNELLVQFPGDSEAIPSITISQIGTAASKKEISLAGMPMTLINGAFEAATAGKSALTTAIRYERKNRERTMIYTDTKVTIDTKADASIFDVLMQMDWLTSWLNESVFSITKLQRLLEPRNSADHGFLGLQQHLGQLSRDTKAAAVTPQEIAKLSLPENVAWRTVLAATLLDDKGLLISFAAAIEDDVPQKLNTALDQLINAQVLDKDPDKNARIQQQTKKKLYDLLLLAHERQLHTVEKFLQNICQLPMNCAKGVVSWAGASVYQILTAALHDERLTQLPDALHPVLRHAEATVQLNLSNRALHLFLKHPDWLGSSDSKLKLSLHSMYLFDRFNHFMITHQHEESLLGYLELANSTVLITAINNSAATLLNWDATEVTVLTARLDSKKAQTMKDLDWLMRCHATCIATGLSAASLLGATALNNDSEPDTWKKVGEAVIAASH